MKRMVPLLFLILLIFTGCATDKPSSSQASGVAPSEMQEPGEDTSVPLMTWEIYQAKGSDGINTAWLHGTVQSAELRDDSYGTPYYHLVVLSDDGQEYKLVSNYAELPFDFEPGKSYTFTVRTAAARGVLVTQAEEG